MHNIRNANRRDIDTVMTFEEAYMRRFEPDDLERWLSAKEKIALNLEKLVDQMFVVEDNKRVVAFAYWDFYEQRPCLYSIYVSDAYRRLGIGQKLLCAIEKQIVDRGYSVLTLSTRVENPAQNLFRITYTFIKEKEGWLYYEKNIL